MDGWEYSAVCRRCGKLPRNNGHRCRALGLTGCARKLNYRSGRLALAGCWWIRGDVKRQTRSLRNCPADQRASTRWHALTLTGRGTGLGRGIAVSGRFAKVAELPGDPPTQCSNTWIARRAGMPRGFRCALAMRQQGAPSKASHIALPPRNAEPSSVPMASFFHAGLANCGPRVASSRTRSPTKFVVPVDQSEMIPRFLDRIGHLKVVGQGGATLTRATPREPRARSASPQMAGNSPSTSTQTCPASVEYWTTGTKRWLRQVARCPWPPIPGCAST